MGHRIAFAVVLVVMLVGTHGAWAQSAVRVRLGDHDGYSRMVFDWPKRGSHTVTKDGETLSVTFGEAGTFSSSSEHTKGARNIGNVQAVTKTPLKVTLTIPSDSRMRHFWAGDRLVLDVYNSPSGKVIRASGRTKPSTIESAPASKTVKKKIEPVPTPPEEKLSTPKQDMPKQVVEAVQQEPLQEHAAPPPPPPATEPTPAVQASGTPGSAIILSTTQISGVAAFRRDGLLWLVNDNENLKVQPQIKLQGSHKDKPPFELLDAARIEGAAVFSYKAPIIHLRGEGGGLIWQVIDSPQGETAATYKPIEPIRKTESNAIRNGQIIWPLKGVSDILNIQDPITGRLITVVTVKDAKYFAGPPYEFPDFYTLSSPIGLAIIPKVDDLDVKPHELGIEISRPNGLALSHEDNVVLAQRQKTEKSAAHASGKAPESTIYDLEAWSMGDLTGLAENRVLLLAGLNDLSEAAQVEGLLKTAKLHIAQAHGLEAVGFLNLARERMSALNSSAEFQALLGAAEALAWNSEQAFNMLINPNLDNFQEIGYWRAYALADLGDWIQARQRLPESMDRLRAYPDLVFNRMAPVIAEVLLRAGNIDQAEPLLERLNTHQDQLLSEQKAALLYLLGEAARQKNDIGTTRKYWEELAGGQDDLYRAKAGLALAQLLLEKNEITREDAIDRLERLRYAWRGDDLETNIHYNLGKNYFDHGDHARALNILREAASYAVNNALAKRITGDMQTMFKDLFLSDKLNTLSPADAVALYEQFSELVPPGKDGDQIVENLAQHLGQSGLHGRASDMLSHQLNHRLSGEDAVRVGLRLAATQLMDNTPDKALESLNKAETAYDTLTENQKDPVIRRDLSLLRARALSHQGNPDEALVLLEGLDLSPDVNRLRADIAWNAGYWDDAADALNEVIIDRDLSLTRPLDVQDSTLILHRAVALNLSDDRIGLANHREQYADAMAQTPQGTVFEVISRPRQNATLADRETLLNVIGETDLFGDFLKTYSDVE